MEKRYDRNSRFLNLDSLADDELVKKYGLTLPGYTQDARSAGLIFRLTQKLAPPVLTLSLANNNLSGIHLAYLDKHLSGLRNLSLQNNNLKEYSDIGFLSSRRNKMKQLRELVLIGTPLYEDAYRVGRGDHYRSEITRRFPVLEMLDHEVVKKIGFTDDGPPALIEAVPAPNATSFPLEMGISFITGVDGSLVSNFLVRFFSLFDSERSSLLDVYDDAAYFSYSCNTSIPIRARLAGLHSSMPNQKKLTWEPWLHNAGGGSRNLNRPQVGLDKMLEALHQGPAEIARAQVALPETKHDVQGSADKFAVDSFPVPHGQGTALLLTIHGEFMEVRSQGVRSFDRAFMLVPAPEGSRAKAAGWDVVILSDQWTIRGYSNPIAWKPGPMLVQAEARPPKDAGPQKLEGFSIASLPLQQQQDLRTLPEAQQNLVLQVCARTRLNVNFAGQCLVENGWDFDRAIINFEQVKGTLPKDAFL